MSKTAKPMPNPRKKAEDSVIYKALIDLGLLCIAMLLLSLIGKNYVTVDGYSTLNPIFMWISIVGAALAVLSLAAAVFAKGALRAWGKVGVILFAVVAAASYALFRLWYEPIGMMYFLAIATCALYLIYLIYQTEFFLISLVTVLSGGAFYAYGRTSLSGWIIIAFAISVVVIASCATLAARSKKGMLTIGKKSRRVFAPDANLMPLYFVCIVWPACMIASAIVGSVFAYYCVFVAAGIEFLAACYYTIKLN